MAVGKQAPREYALFDEQFECGFDLGQRGLLPPVEPPARDAIRGVRGGGVQRNVLLKLTSYSFDLGIGRRVAHMRLPWN